MLPALGGLVDRLDGIGVDFGLLLLAAKGVAVECRTTRKIEAADHICASQG
jgi:hypothetical protein